jgi:hypothetical protein
MRICVHNLYVIELFSLTCYDTTSYYDSTPASLLINYYVTSDIFRHRLHNTSYDTLSLRIA